MSMPNFCGIRVCSVGSPSLNRYEFRFSEKKLCLVPSPVVGGVALPERERERALWVSLGVPPPPLPLQN